MKKGEAPKPRICVEYKGKELILQPGHEVYELNVFSGIVKKYELIKKPIPLKIRLKHFLFGGLYGKLDKRPRYLAEEIPGVTYLIPAFDIDSARIKFKNAVKKIGLKVKFDN